MGDWIERRSERKTSIMKTQYQFRSGRRVCRRLTFNSFRRLLCVATCVTTSCLGSRDAPAQDQQAILHPGTIAGEVRIMDPDNPGVSLDLHSISVRATATSGGTTYTAGREFSNTRQYTLTVEAGPWPYEIHITARAPKYNDAYFTWHYASVVVSEGGTVTKDFVTGAFLDLRMDVTGETVTSIMPLANCVFSPGNAFSLSPCGVLPNPVVIPVPASTSYGPYLIDTIGYVGPDNDLLRAPGTELDVNTGQTVPVVVTVVPGYIQGTVTVVGPTLEWGRIDASVTKTAANPGGAASSYLANAGANQFTFRFPCIPALSPNVQVSCTLRTDHGDYFGELRYPNVLPGQTAICNWEFIFTGSIAGTFNIAGLPPITGPSYAGIHANGPGSSLWSHAAPDGTYQFTGLGEGTWSIVLSDYTFRYDTQESGIYWTRSVQLYGLPAQTVQLPAGASITDVDLGFTPGFVSGRILDPNSAALPLLKSAGLGFKKYSSISPATFSDENVHPSKNASLPTPLCNDYWTFASPGLWQYNQIELHFASNAAHGLVFHSSLQFFDFSGYPSTFNTSPQVVQENGTTELNLDYKTGQIRVHLRVADNRPLSQPYANGTFLRNPAGVLDRSLYIDGMANWVDVVEGIVHLYGLPGTYQLTARATVSGSTTTFGQPFLVTIGPGDEVDQDPEGPNVDIQFPPGEYVTCQDSVVATGTVTDASGVASFTINGQPVNDPPMLAPLSLSPAAITENGSATLSGPFADPDVGDTHTVSIVWSDGSSATVPSGKTDFRFVTADLDFHSTAYDWLVVAGMKAKFKGVGTINGAGDYGFMVTASDGNAPGQIDVDRFRIQIWDRATGVKVYDNQLGTDEMTDANDAIEGGAIEIHKVN
jgi:hypothetical protein